MFLESLAAFAPYIDGGSLQCFLWKPSGLPGKLLSSPVVGVVSLSSAMSKSDELVVRLSLQLQLLVNFRLPGAVKLIDEDAPGDNLSG